MPLPCSSPIFSSSVICFSTISARSSGERLLFIQGKFCLPVWPELGGCADAVAIISAKEKIAKTVLRLQNRLFIGDLAAPFMKLSRTTISEGAWGARNQCRKGCSRSPSNRRSGGFCTHGGQNKTSVGPIKKRNVRTNLRTGTYSTPRWKLKRNSRLAGRYPWIARAPDRRRKHYVVTPVFRRLHDFVARAVERPYSG